MDILNKYVMFTILYKCSRAEVANSLLFGHTFSVKEMFVYLKPYREDIGAHLLTVSQADFLQWRQDVSSRANCAKVIGMAHVM